MPAEAAPRRPAPGAPRRCAVLGDPVGHSLSPALHAAAYAALGLEWTYGAERVPAGGLPAFLDRVAPDPTWRGLSLTMPLKREVLALPGLAGASPLARAVGAANTLVAEDDGWHADNTDVPGAAAALRSRWPAVDDALRTVTVLGGGATATSTGWAACDLGARTVRLLVRDGVRAVPTATALAAHPTGPEVEVVELGAPGASGPAVPVAGELLVSTVPAGAQTPAVLAAAADVAAVFEVVYDPWPTPLAGAAAPRGQVVVDGLDLLAHQAVGQVRLFTGHEVAADLLRAAGEQALAARSGPA